MLKSRSCFVLRARGVVARGFFRYHVLPPLNCVANPAVSPSFSLSSVAFSSGSFNCSLSAFVLAVGSTLRSRVGLGRSGRFQRHRLQAIVKTVRACSSTTATAAAPKEIFRKDYTPPDYWIREVQLVVRIFPGQTEVSSKLRLERRLGVDASTCLRLDGEGLKLKRVALCGSELALGSDGYWIDGEALVISSEALRKTTDVTWLETEVQVVPEANTHLSGLYHSGSMYCTQMEAEGFRRFTYFLDRPDVMAKYTKVRIEADEATCPVLLSNGNRIEAGKLVGGRHYSVWSDPFEKPCYLFAIVAGALESIQDTFRTKSGRVVHLEIFAAKEDTDQLWHAMRSLQRAMKWDEDRFGLEYDLDIYNIVAVRDFNMGAMENKSLNVFNTALTLALPETATDDDYERIEGVIGHEYFHNWTGNRVTCRDWFQLTLKEGLTVYRDQEFSADMGSKARKRIEDVRILRSAQFPEDGSPMAHPIRPEKYAAIDNFYTATVYNKGAEVIRMYDTLLGRDGFRNGMDLYFQRHDGTAVSCDDFRAAMADANHRDLSQFENWYLQAGTPLVTINDRWDQAAGKVELEISQVVPDTPGQTNKKPMLIPVRVGLLDRETGKELVNERVLELTAQRQSFEIELPFGVTSKPIPSLLRDFSAPVRLEYSYTDEELALLAGHDTDSFNRWEAMQRLGTKAILAALAAPDPKAYVLDEAFIEAMRRTVVDRSTEDLSLIAYAMLLPAESTLMEVAPPPIDPMKLHLARNHVRDAVAKRLREEMYTRFKELKASAGPTYTVDGRSASRRRLCGVLLGYLVCLGGQDSITLSMREFDSAGGMTEKMNALGLLCQHPDAKETKDAIARFYADAKGDANVIDKWFSTQARADVDDLLQRVEELMEHPDFTMKNPNRLRSVAVPYLTSPQFHMESGEGYDFAVNLIIKVDALNPQIAARLANAAFRAWRKFDENRGQMIAQRLDILCSAGLSKDTLEVVSKTRGV